MLSEEVHKEELEKRRNRKRLLLLFFVLSVTACSSAVRQLFFDIPPAQENPADPAGQLSTNAILESTSAKDFALISPDTWERPAIEAVLDWEEAQTQLPQHELGGVDWPVALEQGLIRPRTGTNPEARAASFFKLDFYIKSPIANFDAFFPHSVHTAWLGCKNCHPALYRYKDNELNMADVFAGKSCGTCHGKVAFPVTQCNRCHTDM